MYLRIDPNSGIPLGLQIVRGLRLAIAQGRLAPSEQLPSAREMAGQLQVNFHTVRKAYGDLQTEGLLEFQRGKGTFVAKSAGRPRASELRALVREHVGRLVEDLAGSEVSAEDLLSLAKEEIERVVKSEKPK